MSDQLYTASRLRVWNSCHRAHLYRYILGIQTPSGPAGIFGTAAHAALEAWYRAWQAGDLDGRLDAAFAAIEDAGLDPVDRIRLRCLIAAYHIKWANEDWDVVAVEVEFRYWIGDIELGGKIDAIIRDRATGRCYLVEHKTSTQDTSAGSPYWAKLALDTQISIYIDGAAYGLDTEVAGCIYDVLKRPQHEPKLATPPEKRKFTDGKGCKSCGGSAKAGAIEQGRGYLEVVFASEVKRPECSDCKGTGWKCDADGNPQAPRLHANLRATDESLEEFEDRLVAEIAARPDDFLSRGTIVRLAGELPKMREELLAQIQSMRALEAANLHPPNHSACSMGREMCGFFAACTGEQSIDDERIWPRTGAHPELNRAA